MKAVRIDNMLPMNRKFVAIDTYSWSSPNRILDPKSLYMVLNIPAKLLRISTTKRLGYGLDDRGSRVRFLVGASPPRPERLWGPPSLLSNGYQGLFTWG
jgi:hypothetical protein